MTRKNRLDGKKVLIVDDEKDILDTLEDLLPMCQIKKASTFDEVKVLLGAERFDLAILDIMGVDGYALLEMRGKKALPLLKQSLVLAGIMRRGKSGKNE